MASGDNSSLRVEQRKVPYLTTRDGWLKLAVVLDLAARRVIGWAMRHTMAGELTAAPSRRAIPHAWHGDGDLLIGGIDRSGLRAPPHALGVRRSSAAQPGSARHI